MQYHDLVLSPQALGWLNFASQPQDIRSCFGRIHSIVTTIERRRQLREDAPDKGLLSILVFLDEILDDHAKVPSATVLHVQMEVLGVFEMLAVVVGDDVWMSQRTQDGEFGVQLLPLFLAHLDVAYFFPT